MLSINPKLFFLFLFGYLLIFGPDFKIIDLQFYSCLLFSILAIFSMFFKNSLSKIYVYKFFLIFFIFLSYLLIWSDEIFGLINITKFFIYFLAARFYVESFVNYHKYDFDLIDTKILKFIFFWGIIDSIFPILFMLSPEIQFNILSQLNIKMSYELLTSKQNIRFNNLSLSGGTLSIVYLICLISGIILFLKKKIKFNIFIIGFILLFIAMMISGRIGLYSFFLITLIYILSNFWKNFLTLSKFIIPVLFIIILILILNKNNQQMINFAFEIFNNDSFTTKSLDNLIQSHFVFRFNSIPNFFFGHGSRSISDIGYINFIYIFGIFVSTYFFFWYLFILTNVFKSNSRSENNLILSLSKFVVIFYPIFLLKQFIFGNSKGLIVIIMIILWMFFFIKKLKNYQNINHYY